MNKRLITILIVFSALAGSSLPAAAAYIPFNTNVNMNIGIGTSTPQGALVVTNGNVGIGTWAPGGAFIVMNGNVGIGTANPSAKLYINASAASQQPLLIQTAGAPGAYSAANSGILILDASGTEIMRLYASDPNTTSDYNSGNLYIGYQAGQANPSDNSSAGFLNIGLGYQAMQVNTTGEQNTATGAWALSLNTMGNNNTAYGDVSLFHNTIGSFNTAVGQYSLEKNVSGINNTAIGADAGVNGTLLQTMQYSTFVGYSANSSVDGVTNSTAIGSGAQVTASNQVVIGNGSVTQTLLNGNVGIGTTNPGQILDVQGTVRMLGLTLTGNGAANGNVLVGNSVGVRTWMPVTTLLTSGGSNYWNYSAAGNIGVSTIQAVGIGTTFVFGGNGEAALSIMNGNVGIGTWVPVNTLQVGPNTFVVNNLLLMSVSIQHHQAQLYM